MKFRSSSWLSLSSHKVVVAATASSHRSPCFDSESLVSVDAYYSAIEGYGYEYFLVGVDVLLLGFLMTFVESLLYLSVLTRGSQMGDRLVFLLLLSCRSLYPLTR